MTTYTLSNNQTALDEKDLAAAIQKANGIWNRKASSSVRNGRPVGKRDPMVQLSMSRAYDPASKKYYDAKYTKSGGMGFGDLLRMAAPLALSFFAPGVGTALGTALGASGATASALGGGLMGAGLGAVGGGGLKGAALGGLSGGIGGYASGGGSFLSGLNKAGFGNTAFSLADGGSIGNILSSLGADAVGGFGNLGGGGLLSNANTLLQAASLFGGAGDAPKTRSTTAPKEKAFTPVRPDAMSRPNSLSDLAAFSNEQERSALATKGVNTGLAQDEQSYYRNLLQRSLIGEGNKVNAENPNWLMPIESQYHSGQGKNTNDIMSFLKSLQS